MRAFLGGGHMLQRLQRDILDFVGSGFLKFVGSRHLRPNACKRSFILGKLRSLFQHPLGILSRIVRIPRGPGSSTDSQRKVSSPDGFYAPPVPRHRLGYGLSGMRLLELLAT